MNKTIKGVLIGLHVRGVLMSRMLFACLSFALLSAFGLMLLFLREIPLYFDHGKSLKPSLYFQTFSVLATVLFYILAREDYYYYELNDRSITVKNLLKKYEQTFQVDQIIKLSFDHGPYDGSSVTITFNEEGFIRTKKYGSNSLSTQDFVDLRNAFEAL
jgi:hypothetical protein